VNMGYKLITILYLCSILIHASIDDEIEAIQKAPVEQRFELMNALKRKITKMKEEERMNTINKLQEATQGKEIKTEDSNLSQENNSSISQTHIENNHHIHNIQEELIETAQEESFNEGR